MPEATHAVVFYHEDLWDGPWYAEYVTSLDEAYEKGNAVFGQNGINAYEIWEYDRDKKFPFDRLVDQRDD